MANTYEVELKFRIEIPETVETLLLQRGATACGVVGHVDRYFNHPSRDFRQTDEALRIRTIGDVNCVTYKGAVVGSTTKTRHEIEVGFEDGAKSADQLLEMFGLLGFRFVRDVRKTRRVYRLDQEGYEFEFGLDEVPELGHFFEIELLASEAERSSAESALWQMAHSLGLVMSEPRSYLNLLVEKDDASRRSRE